MLLRLRWHMVVMQRIRSVRSNSRTFKEESCEKPRRKVEINYPAVSGLDSRFWDVNLEKRQLPIINAGCAYVAWQSCNFSQSIWRRTITTTTSSVSLAPLAHPTSRSMLKLTALAAWRSLLAPLAQEPPANCCRLATLASASAQEPSAYSVAFRNDVPQLFFCTPLCPVPLKNTLSLNNLKSSPSSRDRLFTDRR